MKSKSKMFELAAELLEVAKDKGLQARVVEAARTLFQNEDVNVNPVPAIMCEFLPFLRVDHFASSARS